MQESVLLDFSNTFKQGTRGFKKKAAKKVKVEEETKEGVIKEDASGPNKDLEDGNMGIENACEVIEIPRNLTIT